MIAKPTTMGAPDAPSPIFARCAVVGGGMAGLAAGLALAPHTGALQLFERDPDLGEDQPRRGAPQGRQLHILLKGGLDALETLDPGFERALLDAGASPQRIGLDDRIEDAPMRDLDARTTTQSRPFLEAVAFARLRRALGDRLILEPPMRVLAIEPEAAGATVHVRHGEPRGFDLVIDAAGRASSLARNAHERHGALIDEERLDAPVTYASAILVGEPDAAPSERTTWWSPGRPPDGRSGLVAPIERGRFLAAMAGRFDDAPPTDEQGFRAFADGLRWRPIGDALRRCAVAEGPRAYRFERSVWRRYDRAAPALDVVLPLGDAVASLCPVYGQGVTLAAQQAVALRRLLDDRAAKGGPQTGLGGAYHASCRDALALGWLAAALGDLRYPDSRGAKPAALDARLALYGRAGPHLAADPAVHRAVVLLGHLAADDRALERAVAAAERRRGTRTRPRR